MNRFIAGLILTACIALLTGCNQTKPTEDKKQDDAATALLNRIVKNKAGAFMIEYIPQDNGKDVFELESKGDKIVLRGNNAVSVASALNHYLKHFCHQHYAWDKLEVTLPDILPAVTAKVRRVSPYKYRYYLNYCTFNVPHPEP